MTTTVIIGTSVVAVIVVLLIAICCKDEPYEVNNLDETVFKKKESESVHKTRTIYDEEDDLELSGDIPGGWWFFYG